MNWEQTLAHYLDKLQKTQQQVDAATNIANRTRQHLKNNELTRLDRLQQQINTQLKKLKTGEFHIAVIGLEKAGKSALLNAWLGSNILPSMEERCTYTSTELWSAPSTDVQSYITEYYTEEEFEKDLNEKHATLERLEPGTSDHDRLRVDIEEISKLSSAIYSHLGTPLQTVKFQDINEIRDDLLQAVALDRARARAIKRISIETTAMHQGRNIIFHDVPGFDSPVKLHQDLAREKLKWCDAIVYAKRFTTPDLVGPETSMLAIAKDQDDFIPVIDKIIIALTHSDASEGKENVAHLLNKAREKWNGVPADRFIPVCPPALLADISNAALTQEQQTFYKELNQRLADRGLDHGIDNLKQAVSDYIENDRTRILARRCEGMLREANNLVDAVLTELRQHFPDDPTKLADEHRNATQRAFSTWWTKEWELIQKDFSHKFLTDVMPKNDGNIDSFSNPHPIIGGFRDEYNNLIENFVGNFDILQKEEFDAQYALLGHSDSGVILVERAHNKIREKLTEEALNKAETVTEQLSMALGQVADEIIVWLEDRLFNIPGVREEMNIDTDDLRKRTNHGLATLFLRFTRPTINLFLAAPNGNRIPLMKQYAGDITVLETFYNNADSSFKSLRDYLRTGFWQIVTAATDPIKESPKASPGIFASNDAGKPNTQANENYVSPTTKEEVYDEILNDIVALEEYLLHSVYRAAGFEAYCNQELDRIRRHFLDIENQSRGWQDLMLRAFQNDHPAVRGKIPNTVRDFQHRQAIAEAIQALRTLHLEVAQPDQSETRKPVVA